MHIATNRFFLPLLAGLLVVLVGCTEPNPLYQPGPLLPDECRAGQEVSESFEVFERPEKVDLWFVVSNSEAMPAYQDALAEAMAPMLEELDEQGYDIHVGVSTMDGTADVGLAPRVTDVDGCADNGRQVATNEHDDWITTAECNVQQGGDGHRRQQALDVVDASLIEDPTSLGGFRREKARLIIVMVANEDDCSGSGFSDDAAHPSRDVCAWQAEELRDVAQWVEEIRDLSVAHEGISLAVISGPPMAVEYEEGEPVRRTCSSTLGSGYPSPRLYEAARLFGERGLFGSACVFDFREHLDEISRKLIRRDSVSICVSHPMVHEPLQMEAVYIGGDSVDIPLGEGFTFLGYTEECENGALQFHRQGIEDAHRVRTTYCRY